MERFLKRKLSTSESTSSSGNTSKEIDLDDLPWDPSERKKMSEYHPNQRDEIRRKEHVAGQCGSDAFVTEGFNSWNKTERFALHVGDINSFHNRALKKSEDLMRQDQSIAVAFHRQDDIARNEYRIRLNASIKACRYLLKNWLPFRGHDESKDSISKGLFLETLELIADGNDTISNVILKNAPENNQMVAPSIQKDIVTCFAKIILKSIFEEIGNDVFGLLVDESSDVSKKEQMAVVLRYVDTCGVVKERFVGIVHVTGTSASNLKSAIDSLFAEHGLSLKQVRGQGYDGASNMSGEFNGLKALILRYNSSAYYVHCFAHQLQLVVVAVAKKHEGLKNFFELLTLVVNVVSASCKRKDMIRESYRYRVQEAIGKGEIETGKGLNQELSLIRAGDTRWGSHHKTCLSLIALFSEVVKVLEYVEEDGDNSCIRLQATGILSYFKTFDFLFYLHLMFHILEVTNLLSQALQRKDQDILEAVSLVGGTKQQLQKFREDGFEQLLKKIYLFGEKHGVKMLDMAEGYVNTKNRRQMSNITNRHYYEFDIFNTVVDMQLQEFGDRFGEAGTELLKSMAALSPCDSFSQFEISDLLKLSEFYPCDFTHLERITLEQQLHMYYAIVHQDERFANLNGIADLARLMVQTKKHTTYPLVYRLLKLALVLPVATATVERCFSKMKLVKSDLRNRIGDDFLNAALICTIEKEALGNVTNDEVINRFQDMKSRREQL